MWDTPQKLDTFGVYVLWVKQEEKGSYSAEFKIDIIMNMRKTRLGYRETARKYNISKSGKTVVTIQQWERIFLEEGAEGLRKERRGSAYAASSAKKGRSPKLDSEVEEDLIAENQCLRMEIECLKNWVP